MVPEIGTATKAMSAAFEFQLYMLGMLHAHVSALPQVGLTLHIED
jgi:hypothetical protein